MKFFIITVFIAAGLSGCSPGYRYPPKLSLDGYEKHPNGIKSLEVYGGLGKQSTLRDKYVHYKVFKYDTLGKLLYKEKTWFILNEYTIIGTVHGKQKRWYFFESRKVSNKETYRNNDSVLFFLEQRFPNLILTDSSR